MKLLDLFCKAGGAGAGYHRAGFEVTGVDIEAQPRYPFEFVRADALDLSIEWMRQFDAIHASPPCQGYSATASLPWLADKTYPLLIEDVRNMLDEVARPYVIENVERAPLRGVTLCGAMFGLRVYRHRRFESNALLLQPPHEKHRHVINGGSRSLNRRGRSSSGYITVAGHQFRRDEASAAMGIDWMTRDELAQAIPPAYTEFIGRQLVRCAPGLEAAG